MKPEGYKEIEYFSKPIPLYQVTDIYVDYQHKGKGYISRILDRVEQFIREKRKPGVLVDGIMIGDPASGMYTRRGWKEVPSTTGLLVYNWLKDIPLDILTAYPFRYADHAEQDKRL